MLIIQERFGILNGAVFGLGNMVALADVIVPIHAFGQESMRPVMVPGDGAQDGQAVLLTLAALDRIGLAQVGAGFEAGQRGFGVLPHIGSVPGFIQSGQAFPGRSPRPP